MKKFVGLVALAFVGLNLSLPALAIRTTGQDVVCRYKYKVGDSGWTLDSTGGTTRANARHSRTQVLERLEQKAVESGETFEVSHIGCGDPFGHN